MHFLIHTITNDRGVVRNLLREKQNRGSGGWKSPIGVQGQSPGGDLGALPPEAGDIYRMHNKFH